MVFGIGIDIIEVQRVGKSISQTGFKEKIFTPSEIQYCENKKRAMAMSFAARFAAKEAFFKALGTGWRNGFLWTEVEILKDKLDKPSLKTYGRVLEFMEKNNILNAQVSLSHIKETACAIVILETKN